MGRKIEPREYERGGYKGEILGLPRNCRLWIDGKQYTVGFTSLRSARLAFFGYVKRHPKAT
jgi:hypothetical protein